MEYYSLKGHGSTNDYMMIMREMDEGFVIRIVRDLDVRDFSFWCIPQPSVLQEHPVPSAVQVPAHFLSG